VSDNCIHLTANEGIILLEPCGEIDSSNSSLLEDAFWLASHSTRQHIYLGLSNLEFISSAGIGLVLTTLRDLKNIGAELSIGEIRTQVKDIFNIINLDSFVSFTARPALANITTRGIVIEGSLGNLKTIRAFLEKTFEDYHIDRSLYYGMLLACDELCSNVIRHNYGQRHTMPLSVMATLSNGIIEVSVIDRGYDFDPTDHISREVETTIDAGIRGGLGLPLIRLLTDSFNFHRKEGHNIIQLAKNVPEQSLN
jgi:serine/threonine-protein kinase RsbW